jgi:hypothetical protein
MHTKLASDISYKDYVELNLKFCDAAQKDFLKKLEFNFY